MKKRILLIVSLLLSFVLAGLQAQENEDLLSYYDSTFMTVGYDYFGGITLNFQGQSTNIQRGIPLLFQEPLLEYETTADLYNEYAKKTKIGNVCTWGGLGLTLVSAFVPIFFLPAMDTDSFDSGQFWTGYYVCLSGYTIGLISTLVGDVYYTSGKSSLLQSVNLYNRNKARDY